MSRDYSRFIKTDEQLYELMWQHLPPVLEKLPPETREEIKNLSAGAAGALLRVGVEIGVDAALDMLKMIEMEKDELSKRAPGDPEPDRGDAREHQQVG